MSDGNCEWWEPCDEDDGFLEKLAEFLHESIPSIHFETATNPDGCMPEIRIERNE